MDPAMKAYALAATIVGLHLLFLALYTGRVRVQKKVFSNPEDAALSKVEKAAAEHPDVVRVQKAHQNLIENAIPFLTIGLLYALTGPTQMAARIYFFSFVAVRIVHSIVYILGKQPWRTIMFGLGTLVTFGMAFQVIRAVL